MKPDDKPKRTEKTYEDPKLFIVIGDEVFPRPGLETAFVDYSAINEKSSEVSLVSSDTIRTTEEIIRTSEITVGTALRTKEVTNCLCYFVKKEICVCNKMRSVSCNCHGYVTTTTTTKTICTCQGHVTGCRCAPVH